jgi:hypothetical protein
MMRYDKSILRRCGKQMPGISKGLSSLQRESIEEEKGTLSAFYERDVKGF